MPGGMSFEEYFRLEGHPEDEQYLRFLLGLAPRGLHRSYLVDASRVDLAQQRVPSTGAACDLCAGAVGAMATRILLLRGGVPAAPVHHQYDAYRQRSVRTRLPLGNDGPVQRAKLAVARRQLQAMRATPRPAEPPADALGAILAAARWAPSGDNVQPWRFEVRGPESVRVVFAPHDVPNPYEYRQGEPGRLAAGMMLEALRIAATAHGRAMTWTLAEAADQPVAHVKFPEAPGVEPDPLYAVLPLRSVNRRPYKRRQLLARERVALEAALGPGLRLHLYEGDAARLGFARLGAAATRLRLRLPEAFPVHQDTVDWAPGDSATGIPARATGFWRATMPVMRWAMRDWRRMDAVNRLGGTAAAAVQLDWAPALGSAAFLTVALSPDAARDTAGQIAAGAGLLRLWLTATRLGLAMQPGFATLIFGHYGAASVPFTADQTLLRQAARCAAGLRALVGEDTDRLVFLARIGEPRGRSRQRSVRRSVAALTGQATDATSSSGQSEPFAVQ
jgi:nitroreductase